MVILFDHLRDTEIEPRHKQGSKLPAAAGGLLVGLTLGYLGWVLPTPGDSLLFPTLIVAGIGLVIAVAAGVFALHPNLQVLWVFCGVGLVFTVAASLWTYQFSIPASIAWDSHATQLAQQTLAQVNAEPLVNGVPPGRCWTVVNGSVGDIQAPYQMCGTSTPEGHFVTFSAVDAGPKGGGLGYTDRGAATFPDACSTHLFGKWWMFSNNTDGMGSCPVGYTFHGGG